MKTDNQIEEVNDGEEPDILFESGKNIVIKYISEGNGPEEVLKIAQEGTAFAEHIVARMDEEGDAPPEIACKAGCPYCCSMQISITPPEALLLGAYVDANYDDDEKRALLEKIENNLSHTHGKSQEEKVKSWHLTPCVFLKDGSCSVYPIRPFICRSWHSLNARQCLDAFHSREKESEIESLPYRNFIFGTIRDGLQEGCRELGLQWETQIITSAVKSYLAHKDPINAWLTGEVVFFPG